jgi:hypothetical protein
MNKRVNTVKIMAIVLAEAAKLLLPCCSFASPCAGDFSALNSPYIPVDNWIYPAVLRLYSLGYVDTVYLGLRPWTRNSLQQMLQEAEQHLAKNFDGSAADEAEGIVETLRREVNAQCTTSAGQIHVESAYTVMRGISGTPLGDSFHLGQTIVNDYGRPYENGFNNYTGMSGYATAGRFVVYARGEFQGAPSAAGYGSELVKTLATIDGTTNAFSPACWMSGSNCTAMPNSRQTTMPVGPIATATQGRILEAYIGMQVLRHEISFGRQDAWLGPGMGSAMAYSNNAENLYSFRINRTEPLYIPWLSRLTGPFRYDFFVGPLKGHTYPIDPWFHLEKINFKPTKNLEFGFERTVIWGGKDHAPITLHSFWKSFISTVNVTAEEKNSRDDPGARFASFDFTYRLPFVRNWLTLYTDSEVHDDVSPIDAPRHGSWRPGLYLSHFPGLPKMDLRAEGVTSDPPVSRSNGGTFMYWEGMQKQGYTNAGQLMGDWIGREAKGGQAWLTWHLSGNEEIQASWRGQKTPKDFIPGGTTLNDFSLKAVKRVGQDFEIRGNFALEHWKAPIFLPGRQTVTTTTIQLTWFPRKKITF